MTPQALFTAWRGSRNPIWPFEWTVVYADGATFPRVCGGVARLTAQAPLDGIAALLGMGGHGLPSFRVQPTGHPSALIARVLAVSPVGAATIGSITGWRFGFRVGDVFQGVVIHPDGRVEPVP